MNSGYIVLCGIDGCYQRCHFSPYVACRTGFSWASLRSIRSNQQSEVLRRHLLICDAIFTLFTLHTALQKPPMNALFWDLPAQLILSLPSIIWIWFRSHTRFVIDENHFHFFSSHSQADLEIEEEWVRGHCASGEERSAHPVVREVVRLPPERQSKKVKMKTDKFNLRSERGLIGITFKSKFL